MASVSELLDRFVGTFNEGKFEEGAQDFAEGGVLEEVGTGRTVSAAESVQNARAWKAAFPDARGVIENKIVEGNKGAAEIVWTGTNTGSLNDMPATNKQVTGSSWS
jgi:predicted ester cyclase